MSSTVSWNENPEPRGVCRATHVCRTKSGLYIPLRDALSDEAKRLLEARGYSIPPEDIVKGNLVVTSGRSFLSKALGGYWENGGQATPFVNRITLGHGEKTGNLPNLSDSGLVQEITKLDGTPAGTFLLKPWNDVSPDIEFKAAEARFPTTSTGWGSANGAVTIDANGDTILTDTSVNFTNINGGSVQLTDQVKLNTDANNPLVLGVKEIISSTKLKLHNPGGYETPTGTSIEYRIDTPGTQMLVSKLINGNSFPQADYGAAVVVHEAGLLLNNDTLFNRVVFAPNDETIGVLLQSNESTGVEISVRFEWLITF